MDIAISSDLIDFNQVKLVKVNLHYADAANGLDVRKDVLIKKDAPAPVWKVELKDKSKITFDWQATFYLGTNPPTQRQTPVTTTADRMIILETPAS